MEMVHPVSDECAKTGQKWIQFPCRSDHLKALKRAFLDLCKLETGAALAVKPLTVFDKKANADVSAVNLGAGAYEVRAGPVAASKRATAIARGFAKLCEMNFVEANNRVIFSCKKAHDALVGMLMYRAQNVRAATKEEQAAAARGILSAPSQQR
jgi:hypothetical protein